MSDEEIANNSLLGSPYPRYAPSQTQETRRIRNTLTGPYHLQHKGRPYKSETKKDCLRAIDSLQRGEALAWSGFLVSERI